MWYFPDVDRAILAYGDSQGEVMDYVFHGSDEYIKYADDGRVGWRSGWSTRGLGKPEHIARFLEPLDELDAKIKHAFVFLSYGSVDIEWNLSYKRDVLKQDVDTDAFIEEMVVAISRCVDSIYEKGEELRSRGGAEVHVILCVPFAPLPLSDGYLEAFELRNGGNVNDSYKVIDHAERLSLWSQFCEQSQARIHTAHPTVQVVDVRDDFAANGFDAYMLDDEEDHHPDLAKSQHAVATRVEKLRFRAADGTTLQLTPKPWPHKTMYPHVRRRFGDTLKASPQPSPEATPRASPTSSPQSQPAASPQDLPRIAELPPSVTLSATLTNASRDGGATFPLGSRSLSSDSIMEMIPSNPNLSPSLSKFPLGVTSIFPCNQQQSLAPPSKPMVLTVSLSPEARAGC